MQIKDVCISAYWWAHYCLSITESNSLTLCRDLRFLLIVAMLIQTEQVSSGFASMHPSILLSLSTESVLGTAFGALGNSEMNKITGSLHFRTTLSSCISWHF